jgi:hypothetical protein
MENWNRSIFDGETDIRDCSTPDEVRAELFRLRRESSLVSHAMDFADYSGYSGEDKYAMLAYHALKSRAEYIKSTLSLQMRAPPQPFTVKKGE